jgi:hypothetical protein
MNLVPYILGWSVLGIVVVVLAIYRSAVAGREDDSLHMMAGEAPIIAQQQRLGKKIEHIEAWGKSLTALLVIYGLVLAAIFLYHAWQVSNTIQ